MTMGEQQPRDMDTDEVSELTMEQETYERRARAGQQAVTARGPPATREENGVSSAVSMNSQQSSRGSGSKNGVKRNGGPSSSLRRSERPAYADTTSVVSMDSSYVSGNYEKTFLELLVDRLIVNDKAEFTIDLLVDMKLYKKGNVRACEEFARTEGCRFLVQAMEQQATVTDLQWKCCKLIMHLTFHCNRNRDLFLEYGGATAICKAMTKFAKARDVQRCGCGALCNLLSAKQELIVEAGGIDAILNAMKNFPSDQEIQEKASSCLYNLAVCHGDFKELMIEKGAAILLAEAQHRFLRQGYPVNKFATKALERLYK